MGTVSQELREVVAGAMERERVPGVAYGLLEGDTLKAERNAASKKVGEAIKGGAKPDGPEVAALKAASVEAGRKIEAIDAERASVETEVEQIETYVNEHRTILGESMSDHDPVENPDPAAQQNGRGRSEKQDELRSDRARLSCL